MMKVVCLLVLLGCVLPICLGSLDFVGRVQYAGDGSIQYDWSNIEITATYSGITAINASFDDSTGNTYNAYINGQLVTVINTTKDQTDYVIADNLSGGDYEILVTKRTEALFGIAKFTGFTVLTNDKFSKRVVPGRQLPNFASFNKQGPGRRIEFIGDSITCGYGDEGMAPCNFSPATENDYATYGPLVASQVQADIHVECWSGKGMVRNYGDKNVTSTDPFPIYYPRTLANDPSTKWDFSKWIPDAVVINLGTNDYSTQPNPPEKIFADGYHKFLQFLNTQYASNKHLQIFLVCGPMISNPCCNYVSTIAGQYDNTHYIDLQNLLVNGDIGCDGHPNIYGHQKMAAKALPTIRSVMRW